MNPMTNNIIDASLDARYGVEPTTAESKPGVTELQLAETGVSISAEPIEDDIASIRQKLRETEAEVKRQSQEPASQAAYPPELAPLVASGHAVYDSDRKSWMVKRCYVCGSWNKEECCGQRTKPLPAAYGTELSKAGRQAVGLEPPSPPEKPKTPEQISEQHAKSWAEMPWWKHFRSVDELKGTGKVEFLIESFLMKNGVTFFGGPAEGGKSLVGMSTAKALVTGQALFGKFKVVETAPVLWLAAEGSDNGLKIRCKGFRIPNDKAKFISRTLSQGPMFGLDDDHIEKLVRNMEPVVVLETAVRFGEGDEDSAAETNKLAGAVFRLLTYGALAVIAFHHSRKDIRDKGVTLETVLRGSGDFGAMADVVIAVTRDERLYRGGDGPNEIELRWVKGRDFSSPPIRLAVTEKAPEGTPITAMWKPGLISCIDQGGDLKWIDRDSVRVAAEVADQAKADRLEQMVRQNPAVTSEDLAKAIGEPKWSVKATLKQMGYSKPSGRPKKGQPNLWTKFVPGVEPMGKAA